MKKRIFYIISFLVIFCIEVFIALYVRDSFVRPYMGDALVVVLVYSFVRFPVRLFCRSAAIFSVGGNFGNHQPCIKNHFGLHVRLERYCLLWSRMYLYLSV